MKKILLYLLILLCGNIGLTAQNKKIVIKGNMPSQYAKDFALKESSEQKKIAEMGYIDAIEDYCRMTLFRTYGMYDSDIEMGFWSEIDNSKAEDVMDLLSAAAESNMNCQFMYACILSGHRIISQPEAKGYKYTNLTKAKKYFAMFLNGEGKKKPFGLDEEIVKKRIKKVFPDLVK